jgi:hypothetical protein
VIELGAVTVNDTRGTSTNASWTVSTLCSELSDGSGHVLGGQNFGYAVKDLVKTGGLSIEVLALNSMSVLAPILRAISGEGTNSATWIPVITIEVPIDQVAGTYEGLITHSVY